MAATPAKKKKPPTFHFLPKTRAKQLKNSWIKDHKIRSKWRAQKKKEGLTNQTRTPAQDTSSKDQVNADSEPSSRPNSPSTSSPAPSHNKQPLRDLRKRAYTPKSLRTPEAVSSRRDKRIPVGRETGQPNMKLRMDVLLEKIKRDFL